MHPVFVIVSIFFMLLFPRINFAVQDEDFKTIILDGASVPQALGYRIDQLSLAAMRDGLLEPIPYQIDEYNVGGAVYFENWEVPIDGTQNILDAADKVLFLFKDAGEPFVDQRTDGEILAEIRVGTQAEGFRYVYVTKGSRLRSDEQYVRYSAELARVETDFYDLTYDQQNHLIWRNFFLHSFGEKEPFDTMKIRISAAGVLLPFATIEFDNEQIIGEPGGVRVGPIRTTTQLKVTMWMFEIPLLTASLQLHHYPKSLIYDMRLNIPEVRRSLIVNPTAAVSLDGNELVGTRLLTAASVDVTDGAIIDGKMGREEALIIERGIDAENNWLFTSTGKNLDLMAFIDFIGETKEEPLSIVLLDDAEIEDQPERFKGQLANFGVQINGMPHTGVMGFVVSLYFEDGFDGDPRTFSSTIRTLPDIEVRSFDT